MEEFGDNVRWMGVYIAEAHTVDEWPMPCVNSPCRHTQPKDIQQRAKHAQEFIKQFHPPFEVLLDTYVDGWNDPFLKRYAAWPERFYVFQQKHFERGPTVAWHVRWANRPDTLEGHRVDDIGLFLRRSVQPGAPLAPPPLVRTTSQALHAEAQHARVKEVFASYDKEGNGTIDRNQTRALLKSIGYIPEIFSRLFLELDIDGSGSLDLKEFEALFNSIHPRLQEELQSTAQLHDVGGPVEPRTASALEDIPLDTAPAAAA